MINCDRSCRSKAGTISHFIKLYILISSLFYLYLLFFSSPPFSSFLISPHLFSPLLFSSLLLLSLLFPSLHIIKSNVSLSVCLPVCMYACNSRTTATSYMQFVLNCWYIIWPGFNIYFVTIDNVGN